jgi:hypothetical protein
MRKDGLFIVCSWFIILVLFGCAAPAARGPVSQERIPITADKDTFIGSLPDFVSEVEINIIGVRGNSVEIGQGGGLPIMNGQICVLCAETIKIASNLSIYLSPAETIMSGPQGCTIKRAKQGKGVRLVKGEAYLLRSKR